MRAIHFRKKRGWQKAQGMIAMIRCKDIDPAVESKHTIECTIRIWMRELS
jgi:hypothetical protein